MYVFKIIKKIMYNTGRYFLSKKLTLQSTGILLLCWKIQRFMSNFFHVEVNLEKVLFSSVQKKLMSVISNFLLKYLHPLQDATDC